MRDSGAGPSGAEPTEAAPDLGGEPAADDIDLDDGSMEGPDVETSTTGTTDSIGSEE